MMYFEAVIIAVLANGFIATNGQYVDIFQGLQALLQPFQVNTDINRYYDVTTRKSVSKKHGDRRTGEVLRPNNPINNYNLFSTTTKPSKKSTWPNSSQYQPTTRKPNQQTATTRLPWEDDNIYNYNSNSNSNKNVNHNNNYSGINIQYNNRKPSNYYNDEATTESYAKPNNKPNDRRPTQTEPARNISYSTANNLSKKQNEPNKPTSNRNVNVTGFITTNNNRVTTRPNTNPNLSTNNKERPNYNTFTTKSPYLTRPGVKPAPVDENQPPITNKPVTQNSYVGNSRPSDAESFTEGPNTTPTIEIGPDEDDMTPAEKSRYIDLAESMCDNYKALSVKEVVALPLVPSPEGIAVNVTNCTPLNVALIIGGKVSTIEEFPHMALVGWKKIQQNEYSWKCGGSLISDQYILTAGHCTYHEKDYNVVSPYSGPPHAVQLGSSLADNPDALVVKVASVIRHPKYKLRRSYFDVALIKMATRVTFSDTIRPACLGVPPPVGKPIIATGWGRTELGGDQSNELRSVSLPIWDMQDCRRIWGTSLKLPNGPTSESHVCAGEKSGGKDTCQGDSGGPAQVQEGCAWRVVAVTSYGRSCGAPQTPALYATVPRAFVAAQVFGKHRITNNPKRQNGNLQQNNGYGSQQYQSTNQQQNNNRFENQQQSNNRFESQQQNINKYGNQQLNTDYASQQSPNNGYTSAQYTSNFNDNQQYNNQFSQQQLNVNKFANQQQQTTNRYNNQQQSGSYHDQNPNTYQQLSNKGNQQQTGRWNKQTGNAGDEVPFGGWTAAGDEWGQNDYAPNSWSHLRQNSQDTNYFGTTARPWWARK